MVGYVSHMPHAALCTRKPPESADIARFVAPWRTNNHFLGCRLSVPQTTNHQPNDNEPARIPPVGSLADCCWGTTRAWRPYQYQITGILTPNNTLRRTHFQYHFPNSPSARYAAVAPLLFGFKSKRYEYLLRVRLSVKIILYHSYLPSYNLFIYDSVIIFIS